MFPLSEVATYLESSGARIEPGQNSFTWAPEPSSRATFAALPLHRVDHPPPVGPEEFASVLKTHIDRMGVLGSAGTESLSAEFPWDEGALTAMARLPDLRASLMSATGYSSAQADRAAGRTALMLLRSDLHHPWFGRGIFSTLELPIGGDLPTLLALVRELNQWELETPELPPFFGAWVVGPRAPMFQTFVPNQLCVPGIVMNLAVWAASRARMVREWLAEEGTRH